MDFAFNTMDTIGSFKGDKYRMADIKSNPFIPLVALGNIYSPDEDNFYYFPSMEARSAINRTSKDIIRALTSRRNLASVLTTDGTPLYITRGMVLDGQGKIMMSMTIKRENFLQNISNPYYFMDDYYLSNTDYSNFILFVATEFLLNDSYMSILKMIQKQYIHNCYLKGVEVTHTTSQKIEQNTFANEFRINFSTIEQMNYCLKNGVKLLMSNPEEYFLNHPMFSKNGTIPTLEEYLPGYPPDVPVLEYEEDLPF